MLREKFKGDDPTRNRDEASTLFGSAVRSCKDTSRAVEARRAGCETVSVTDSLRLPDRLARRASSQNDLSIVHTEKKATNPSSDDVYVRFDAEPYIGARNGMSSKTRCLRPVLLLLRLSYRFIPCRPLRAHINCINVGALHIASA